MSFVGIDVAKAQLEFASGRPMRPPSLAAKTYSSARHVTSATRHVAPSRRRIQRWIPRATLSFPPVR